MTNLGTLIAQQLAERATIQSALVMASGLGFATLHKAPSKKKKVAPGETKNEASDEINAVNNPGSKFQPTIKKAACDYMLGALSNSLISSRIVQLDVPTGREDIIRKFQQLDPKQLKNPLIKPAVKDEPALQVDFVLAPIDGADALRRGESGSVSIAAVGPAGSFPFLHTSDEFFVVAVGAGRLNNRLQKALTNNYSNPVVTKVEPLNTFVGGSFKLIDLVLEMQPQIPPPVMALMFEGTYERFIPRITPWCRRRRLTGSSFAAALATFDGKLSCAAFVTRLPQLIQCAIAAKGLGGRLFAVPLTKVPAENGPKGASKHDLVNVVKGRILKESDLFVQDRHVVVACTSVSEVCALDRIRFTTPTHAKTNSISISVSPNRVTRQSDTIALKDTLVFDVMGPNVREVTEVLPI